MCTGEKYGKCSVIFGGPAFVGVLGACTCNWYQAAFSPPLWPGYEARLIRSLLVDIVFMYHARSQSLNVYWHPPAHAHRIIIGSCNIKWLNIVME